MKTVDLNKVLEMLVNEEQTEAAGLLHEWFVERSKQIHEELMSEDNSLSQDIEDDQEAIESEEFYGEAQGDDAESDDAEAEAEDEMSDDMDDGMSDDMGDGDEMSPESSISDTIEDLEAVMARLKAEFAEITGEAGEEEVTEADGSGKQIDYSQIELIDDDEYEFLTDAPHGEIGEVKTGVVKGYKWARTGVTADIAYVTKVIDFDEDEDDALDEFRNEAEALLDKEVAKQGLKAPLMSYKVGTYGVYDSKTNEDIGHALIYYTAGNFTGTPTYQEIPYTDGTSGDPIREESVTESEDEVTEDEDDFDDLEESWTLESVKDPSLDGGKEIGSHGAKVAVNDKSPIPQKKGSERVGGKAVEIKSDHHEGHDLETSPEVKARPSLKNQVKKATDGQAKVSKEGDKSAMLNSKAGFGSDSPKSPIGQATDLRGSDFKRK